jgi:ATP-binding cassette, subfamily F, member 3
MIICTANNISKMYGGNAVFNNISLEVHDGDRIALVGRNGSGKTTIFKLLAGIETMDTGEMHYKKGLVVGYLEQIPNYELQVSVREVLQAAFQEIYQIEKEITKVTEAMADPANEHKLQSMFDKYNRLQEEFEKKNGYQVESKLAKVASGLDIEDLMDHPFEQLSGGEKTKVGLATILLQEPDIILLDEPTNHLDLHAIEWLEEYLKSFSGAVMIISHDRYFLDIVCNKVLDLEDGKISLYQGNYSKFVEEKEQKLLAEFQAYQDQQKKIKKMKEAIKRFRDWGNRADNEDMYKKARNMERAIERMEKLDRPILERRKINMEFDFKNRSGKDVIEMKNVATMIADRILFEDVNLLLQYREKLAIVGKNGTGKSTILKMILGELTPDEGVVKSGSGVKIGYLSQCGLDGYTEERVIEAFRDVVHITEGEARFRLAQFLFYGPAVFKKVKDLSGGEQIRLRLAQMMGQDYNLLILDEPTNHLDIESREMLEDALERYEGTILAVSHDRYFLNKLFNKVAWLENQQLNVFIGNYDESKKKRMELGAV